MRSGVEGGDREPQRRQEDSGGDAPGIMGHCSVLRRIENQVITAIRSDL